MWLQKEIRLGAKSRGFHLVTEEVLRQFPELARCRIGVLHLFIKHTSASLSVNENADPSVRRDMENFINRAVPENLSYFEHNDEGPDDMPAHIKASLLGSSVTAPVTDGRLNMGVWQGIYLCEHRNRANDRTLVLTLQGDLKPVAENR